MPDWINDQKLFDETGQQPEFRSKNPHVPASYRLDLEFVCFTNAENLARSNPELEYVEGRARLVSGKRKGDWGHHAWCETKNGEVVDPYFEWKFPGRKIEYMKD